ncbi:hypothetical protein sch_21820 [Serratia plymuthica]|nr:hypothetical protein sch_21820 [Serratia plymuthica]
MRMVMLLLKKGLLPPGAFTGIERALAGYLTNLHRVVYRTACCESPRNIIPFCRWIFTGITRAFLRDTATTETLQPSINQSFAKRNRCSKPVGNARGFCENKMI